MEPALVLAAMIAATCPGEPSERAIQAYAKQAHMDQMLDAYTRKHVSEEVRGAVGNAALVTRIAVEKRITFHWEF